MKSFKEYKPEEYQAMKGQKIYAVHDPMNGGFTTADGYTIPEREVESLRKLLDITVVAVDNSKFVEEAKKAYSDVYEAEFREWARRNPNPTITWGAVPSVMKSDMEPFPDEETDE